MSTVFQKFEQSPAWTQLGSVVRNAQKDDIASLCVIFLLTAAYTLLRDKPDPYRHIFFEKPQEADGVGIVTETRDIGRKLDESNRNCVIFWGSQSGTAEKLANRLGRECRSRFSLEPLVADLSDYDPESIANISQNKFAIFIVSTYGEGDPSDNSVQFLSWLSTNDTVKLPNLRYFALGLGNKNYKFYNRVIDVVCETLDKLDATTLMPVGKADDSNNGTDDDFIEWKEQLFTVFCEKFGLEEKPKQYEATIRIVEDSSLDLIDLHAGEPIKAFKNKGLVKTSPIVPLPIVDSRRLLQTSDRNCLHLEVETSEFPELKYKTGDHLAVWPSNPASEVQRLLRVLGLQEQAQTPLLISSLDSEIPCTVPSPTTWETLFQYYLEICSPISREIISSIALFAPSEASRETLQNLSENKDAYADFCSQHHVTFGRLLEYFSTSEDAWKDLPSSLVLESIPSLSPRYYSISSSSIVSPKKISITVATTSEPSSPGGIFVPGLATDYLQDIHDSTQVNCITPPRYNFSGPNNTLAPGKKIYAHIRKSKFALPISSKSPVIMIAAGSGIAPFRGFLTERARLATIGREVGPSRLFFGCRSEDSYLYKHEIETLEESSEVIQVTTAFSRQESKSKRYVQDAVADKSEELIALLMEQNAYLYICGSASMARDVAARLGECIKEKLGYDNSQLRSWSEGMKKKNRWQEDVWG